MDNSSAEIMVCLVSNQAGIYNFNNLIHNYFDNLYLGTNENKTPFNIALSNNVNFQGESKETIFHPDNEHYCDNIDYCLYNCSLFIRRDYDNGNKSEFWRIEEIEGDIFAIHPNAIWNEEIECYIFEDENE